MKQLLTLALLLATTQLFAQTGNFVDDVTDRQLQERSIVPKKQVSTAHLIADETWLTQEKSRIKILCSNDTINSRLLKAFDGIMIRYSCNYKKDRMGRYREYTYYLPGEVTEQEIIKAIK